jgi:hypothetical protein
MTSFEILICEGPSHLGLTSRDLKKTRQYVEELSPLITHSDTNTR